MQEYFCTLVKILLNIVAQWFNWWSVGLFGPKPLPNQWRSRSLTRQAPWILIMATQTKIREIVYSSRILGTTGNQQIKYKQTVLYGLTVIQPIFQIWHHFRCSSLSSNYRYCSTIVLYPVYAYRYLLQVYSHWCRCNYYGNTYAHNTRKRHAIQ